jgi:hypothetical protein
MLAGMIVAVALAGVFSSSAATLGGVASGALGAARATTQRITGIGIDWTPIASGSEWTADAVTLTTDPGESFQAGDRIRLTIDRRDSPTCEPTATATSGAVVGIGRSALADACGRVAFSDIDSIAVSITGYGLAASFTGSLGDVHGTLAAFGGTVVDPDRTLSAKIGTGRVNGVSYLDDITVNVSAPGLSAADLAGGRLIARFHHTDTQAVFESSGTISLNGSAPIHVDSAADGSAVITVTVDPIRLAEVNRFSVVLSTPQHLGAERQGSAGDHAISTTAGSIGDGSDDGESPGSPVSTALEPIGLDTRLGYQYTEPVNFDGGSLGFCHSFSVTNTSTEPVDWTLTFDTSLVPLWGFDPTAPNAFSSAWNWETVSYDAATHRWTIRGVGGTRVAQPGATVGSMGYCVQNVPTPPVDPAGFGTAVAVSASSHAYWVQLSLSVTSPSHWNLPWEVTIDLADYVCPAGLQGASLQWHSGIQVTKLDATRYTLRGAAGSNTRFVSASRPVSISPLLGYGPTGGQYKLPCGGAARMVVQSETPPEAPSVAEPTPAEPTPAEPTPAESVLTETTPTQSASATSAAAEPTPAGAAPARSAPVGESVPAEPASVPSTEPTEVPEPTGASE